mmetsp:Transcript_10383/g.23486  ORF Transcript_10383/g.23486 Transcript_10383/m.23486 type:complete len:303 (+) Transcript_10383:247-1155(+)
MALRTSSTNATRCVPFLRLLDRDCFPSPSTFSTSQRLSSRPHEMWTLLPMYCGQFGSTARNANKLPQRGCKSSPGKAMTSWPTTCVYREVQNSNKCHKQVDVFAPSEVGNKTSSRLVFSNSSSGTTSLESSSSRGRGGGGKGLSELPQHPPLFGLLSQLNTAKSCHFPKRSAPDRPSSLKRSCRGISRETKSTATAGAGRSGGNNASKIAKRSGGNDPGGSEKINEPAERAATVANACACCKLYSVPSSRKITQSGSLFHSFAPKGILTETFLTMLRPDGKFVLSLAKGQVSPQISGSQTGA